MVIVDWLIKLWDKGGVALVMIVLLFLLARFVGKRGVDAFDRMASAQTEMAAAHTTSMQMIAHSVQTSSAAQVVALGGLTERISRMEGKVDTLGQLAVREVQQVVTQLPAHHGRGVAVATAVEVFDAEEGTPVQGVPVPVSSIPSIPRTPTRSPTPAKGTAYAQHAPRKGLKP